MKSDARLEMCPTLCCAAGGVDGPPQHSEETPRRIRTLRLQQPLAKIVGHVFRILSLNVQRQKQARSPVDCRESESESAIQGVAVAAPIPDPWCDDTEPALPRPPVS